MEETRVQIHTISIKRSGEKLLFQIKLPKNAKKIIGIQVTTSSSIIGMSVAIPLFLKTGNLRLQLNRKDNIFHAEDLSSTELLPAYEYLIGIPVIGFGNGRFYKSGVKFKKLDVHIATQDTIINGFYEDTLSMFSLYNVKIYLTYEL